MDIKSKGYKMPSSMRGKVSLVRCNDYQKDKLTGAVRRALDPFGGMEAFVSKDQKVLIKPNLLSAKSPDRAITTHPVMIEVLVEEVRRVGGEPVVGDSPGGAVRGIERVWGNTGMKEMAERAGVELVNFEASGSVEIKSDEYVFYVSRPVMEADVIINACKLKTHSLTLLTCAIKNMFGVIPGFRKGEQHKLFPKSKTFSRMLVHLYREVTPQLSIADSVVAMEGNGPSSGESCPLGVIAAARDGVALDAIMAGFAGFPEGTIDTTRIAGEMGLGEHRGEKIEVLGEGMIERDRPFKLPSPSIQRLIPGPLAKLVAPLVWVKPVINPERCTGCGFCAENCPVGAISRDGDVFRIDSSACIICMCCHELCPESSVDIKMSRLARLFA